MDCKPDSILRNHQNKDAAEAHKQHQVAEEKKAEKAKHIEGIAETVERACGFDPEDPDSPKAKHLRELAKRVGELDEEVIYHGLEGLIASNQAQDEEALKKEAEARNQEALEYAKEMDTAAEPAPRGATKDGKEELEAAACRVSTPFKNALENDMEKGLEEHAKAAFGG
jgi:hypothetical protein